MSSPQEKERFIQVIRDNKRLLMKVIRSYCSNKEDWKDLEQEILIQLWKAFKNYDDRYKLSTWMYRISLNVAVSHYRKDLKRRNDAPLDEAIIHLTDDHATTQLNDNSQLLHGFIDQLNEFDKALIILYLEENSHKDIAEIMGITETNVSTRLNRVKQKLKTSFDTLNQK